MRFPTVRRFLPLAIAAGLAVAVVPAVAGATSVPGWRVQAKISPDKKEVQLNAVTAVSAANAWAVGDVTGSVLVEHWNGESWQEVPIPAAVTAPLYAQYPGLGTVAADAASNLWAFNPLGGWLRWNGARWTSGKLPGIAHLSVINTSVAVGKNEAWAFGAQQSNDVYRGYAAFFNGTSWAAMTVPGPSSVNGVTDASAVSPADIWAIVEGGPRSGSAVNTLVHWNGRVWRALALPALLQKAANLESVLALTNGDVWVGGGLPSSQAVAPGVAARWNGKTWLVTHLPAVVSSQVDDLQSMVSDGTGGIWAFGNGPCPCAGPFWHYTGGEWAGPDFAPGVVDGGPDGAQALAQVPGTQSIWSAGGVSDAATVEDGLILLYGPVPR